MGFRVSYNGKMGFRVGYNGEMGFRVGSLRESLCGLGLVTISVVHIRRQQK